ncbi:MAG: phosphoribosylamine--glycine ligase [Actinomycetota bacterium]|nr:phosphoribosylamine--glycine ligase [Actinomycetota bacterium]
MRALVVGGGGREHALVWALSRSAFVDELFCAPGNPGIAELAECHPTSATDIAGITGLARRISADLVVVGPEAPLAAGLADALADAGIRVFGPRASGARLESSKAFAKGLMASSGIPTAPARLFDRPSDAVRYVQAEARPLVIKADGLAAGKGVTVCDSADEAEAAIVEAMVERRFGNAGAKILIEDRLEGEELSILALCDGSTIVALPAAQDFKRAYDGDAGPNTGGMGSYSPVPSCTPDVYEQAMELILHPVAGELARLGEPYVGVIYAGLMLTEQGLAVVEFNCRFGDPELQAILPRLTSDFGEALLAATEGSLKGVEVTWSEESCVCVVAASAGYPEADPLPTGFEIQGVDEVGRREGVYVFHAGTALDDGRLVTAGGRVLSVSAVGDDLEDARSRAYDAVAGISFEGMRYRTDIAARAMARAAPRGH